MIWRQNTPADVPGESWQLKTPTFRGREWPWAMTTLKMVKLGFKRLCSCFKGPAGRWQQDLDQVGDTAQSLALSTLKHCFLLFLHTPHIVSHIEAPCCCHTTRTLPIQGWCGAPEGRNSTPAASPPKSAAGQPTSCLTFPDFEQTSRRCILQAGRKSEGWSPAERKAGQVSF